jgi:hypothetical protein
MRRILYWLASLLILLAGVYVAFWIVSRFR